MFYDRFKSLCEKHNLKPSVAATEMGFNKSTVSAWKRNGSTPNREILTKIAEYFNTSVDVLLSEFSQSNDIEVLNEKKASTLTVKDRRDIARDLEAIMNDMANGGALMFDGQPMSDEAKESIFAAMKLGLEAAKIKNKERFTPKKYRK